ncbi:MAG: hypothetical protein NZ555_01075 [Geminicoccaceae bacterium]|nr:hypothetical protein [Geminicoccaceae bacterium]MCX8100339.1 hypothetical protein [Geminicoccaceae bacterium]MDW8368715.1 hypothetical protein [Geminicoccaceae bacterium]
MRALALACCALLASAASPAEPVDVTARVAARPDLAGRLADACARVCQGNRREARLRRVTVFPLGGDRWRVEGEAALRNRQVQAVPAGLGGLVGRELTLFDHTAIVRGRGILDAASCRLTVEAVGLEGDRVGLGRLLDGAVGRVERIERCRELLPEPPRR